MSGSIRLFVDAPLQPGASLAGTSAQAHYLANVMRRGVGDRLGLFNGRDGEFSAWIDSLRRDRVSFVVTEQTRSQLPEPDLWLVFAPLKRDATDLIAQKATELGVAELHPVITTRSNAHRLNPTRVHAIAVEAAEQSERLTVPRLLPLRPLDQVLADWPLDRVLYAALERSDSPPLVPMRYGPRALLVGPEGGFTQQELDALHTRPFVTPVTLGPRILRADTACIVGLALLQGMDGR